MKFLLTKELGRLAKWLRICGFDAEYFTGDTPGALIIAALKDGRTILTRNHRLPLGRGVPILQVRGESVQEQLVEVYRNLGISPSATELFSRCTVCNEPLSPVGKPAVKNRVPPYVFETQDTYFTCPKCGRIYWQGTHWEQVIKALHGIHS